MPQRRTVSTTETDYGIDDTGALYEEETTVSVTGDSRSGTQINVKQTYRDTDGYEVKHEVSMSGKDYAKLAAAEAEANARREIEQLAGRSVDDDDDD